MRNFIPYKRLLIQRLILSIFTEHERGTYCRKSLTLKSVSFHINVFSTEWFQPHVTLGVCSNRRGRAVGSAHIKGSPILSNQNWPSFSLCQWERGEASSHALFRVESLPARVQSFSRLQTGASRQDWIRCPICTRNQNCGLLLLRMRRTNKTFWNCQIECINWGRAGIISFELLANDVRDHISNCFTILIFFTFSAWMQFLWKLALSNYSKKYPLFVAFWIFCSPKLKLSIVLMRKYLGGYFS